MIDEFLSKYKSFLPKTEKIIDVVVGYFMNYTTVSMFFVFIAGMAANAGTWWGWLFVFLAILIQTTHGNISKPIRYLVEKIFDAIG